MIEGDRWITISMTEVQKTMAQWQFDSPDSVDVPNTVQVRSYRGSFSERRRQVKLAMSQYTNGFRRYMPSSYLATMAGTTVAFVRSPSG
jgi:hypothetical protein